ncbi:hypothetical protein BU24DRAFT_368331 [Aaosphaeria arxii CBS 175.79]|uniref:Uncharacterized protein n=1 Tax=Aaosphaeria arxii CBS 175.79 TaxID=1450172 RepID=A0A6A5XXN1_9PLEO|nr:uncharacterized protein BU24DRAFT_368331 [Aaosphaeria arxii CBS 175.79]KAF2018068.1 hypothetical protein BU24DRAFT_368331 [Aaosphaeria arxii CBS 175.79]
MQPQRIMILFAFSPALFWTGMLMSCIWNLTSGTFSQDNIFSSLSRIFLLWSHSLFKIHLCLRYQSSPHVRVVFFYAFRPLDLLDSTFWYSSEDVDKTSHRALPQVDMYSSPAFLGCGAMLASISCKYSRQSYYPYGLAIHHPTMQPFAVLASLMLSPLGGLCCLHCHACGTHLSPLRTGLRPSVISHEDSVVSLRAFHASLHIYSQRT